MKLLKDIQAESIIAAKKSVLDKFLSSRGIDPRHVTKDQMISHSKGGEFKKWKRDHFFEGYIPPPEHLRKTLAKLKSDTKPGEKGSAIPVLPSPGGSKDRRKPVTESRLAQPLKGHEYHKKSDEELHYIRKDAHAAAQAMQGHNSTAENKYRDQVNDAETVLHYRKQGGVQLAKEDVDKKYSDKKVTFDTWKKKSFPGETRNEKMKRIGLSTFKRPLPPSAHGDAKGTIQLTKKVTESRGHKIVFSKLRDIENRKKKDEKNSKPVMTSIPFTDTRNIVGHAQGNQTNEERRRTMDEMSNDEASKKFGLTGFKANRHQQAAEHHEVLQDHHGDTVTGKAHGEVHKYHAAAAEEYRSAGEKLFSHQDDQAEQHIKNAEGHASKAKDLEEKHKLQGIHMEGMSLAMFRKKKKEPVQPVIYNGPNRRENPRRINVSPGVHWNDRRQSAKAESFVVEGVIDHAAAARHLWNMHGPSITKEKVKKEIQDWDEPHHVDHEAVWHHIEKIRKTKSEAVDNANALGIGPKSKQNFKDNTAKIQRHFQALRQSKQDSTLPSPTAQHQKALAADRSKHNIIKSESLDPMAAGTTISPETDTIPCDKKKSFRKLRKESLTDLEKEDKSVKTYGKKPKFGETDKAPSPGDVKAAARAVLTGGTTMTGTPRDDVEFDPEMRNRPGQPDITKKKQEPKQDK